MEAHNWLKLNRILFVLSKFKFAVNIAICVRTRKLPFISYSLYDPAVEQYAVSQIMVSV
jgi:hypothetical protein